MTEITLTAEQVAEVKGDALDLTEHERRILLPMVLVNDLEDAHERYLDPSPWNTTPYNTQGAAAAVYHLLNKVRPEAAASFKQWHGEPYHWSTGTSSKCHCQQRADEKRK